MKSGALPDKKIKYPLFFASAGHLVFIVSYIFFLFFFKSAQAELIYPLYFMPFVAYAFLFCASGGYRAITRRKAAGFFNSAQNILVVFALLTAAPLAVKMTLPEPHNLLIRKLELTLAAPYVLFIICTSAYFLYSVYKNTRINRIPVKKIFLYITVFFFVFYFFISLWFNYANQPTGDEPHYLMSTHSIVNDGDLNLKNNYENEDYKKFYKGALKPHELKVEGGIYSYHPVLISVLISPFYAAAGRAGAAGFMNLTSAFIAAFVFLFIYNIYGSRKNAAVISLICGFTLPVFMFSNQIGAESISAVLVLSALNILLFYREKYLLFLLSAALIPWAHPRNGILWAVLALMACYEFRHDIKKAVFFIFSQGFSIVLLFAFNLMVFNALIPRQTRADIPVNEAFGVNINGILGLFLDCEFGLFIYTPVLLFCGAGAWFLYRDNRKIFYYIVLLFVPYFILISSWKSWYGGGGSSPRFFMAVIFVFFVMLAAVYRNIKSRININLFRFFIFLSFLVSASIFLVPWFRWSRGKGENWILKFLSEFSGIDFNAFFPSFVVPAEHNTVITAAWVIVIAALNLFVIFVEKIRPAKKNF